MKSKWLVPVVVLLAAALLAFGLCRWTQCPKRAASLDVLQDVSWLTRTLNLTPRQELDIKKLQETLQVRLKACDSMQCAARCQLGTVLFTSTNGADKANAMVEEMCKAQAVSEKATLEHIQKVHQLLTPEQQKRYEELVTSCVCSSCEHQPGHENENIP
jgi:Spy/CpxP family protein refolding chaperone